MLFMKLKSLKNILVASITFLIAGCGATTLVSTPIENIDSTPLKISELTITQKKNWGHLDLINDTIPGMSVDKAYRELIGNKKGQKIIVAVLDSGIDLKHEDLDDVLWTNNGERAGDGIDNDNNGYVDDIHGYNFLGESYNEQLEYTRMLRLNIGDEAIQAKAKAKLDEEIQKYTGYKSQLDQMYPAIKNADQTIIKLLNKSVYTKKDLASIDGADEQTMQSKSIMSQMFEFTGKENNTSILKAFDRDVKGIAELLNYNLKVDFNGRTVVGDDPYDITDTNYGNGNPQSQSEDESHGTHVAGIIAAERNNGKGANGVANNVAIMSIRAVPNGDEYDKDVALGIRYAVDNGAKIINGSFGKSFSPNADWVYDAIKYAASKDVLFIHAAGNDGADLDSPNEPNFPNDAVNNGPEIADNVITVGALDPKYGATLVADYSNYGKINVDIFAPGTDIYSAYPNNTYEYSPGTSMAAPAVAGVAALIRSQYPKLSASQVKKIILDSGLAVKTNVILGGDETKAATLSEISTSGKIVNAYNALVMAEGVSSGRIKL